MKFEINLTQDNFEYLNNDQYIKDKSSFINFLIKRWRDELSKAREEPALTEGNSVILEDFTDERPTMDDSSVLDLIQDDIAKIYSTGRKVNG